MENQSHAHDNYTRLPLSKQAEEHLLRVLHYSSSQGVYGLSFALILTLGEWYDTIV